MEELKQHTYHPGIYILCIAYQLVISNSNNSTQVNIIHGKDSRKQKHLLVL